MKYRLRRHPLRSLLLLCVLGVLVAACGGTTPTSSSSATPTAAPAAVSLNVFAAASLTASFKEIATDYQSAHSNVKITYNFNGSQLLEQQIANGAPADIFASADQANMQKATKADLVNTPQVFARNKLVIIVPASNPANITSLKDLAKKGVKLVVGAPAVPIGNYALQILDKLGKAPDYGPTYESSVKGNFVSQEENVTAVVQKVQLGEADAGIVYRTDANTVASKVKIIDIPDNFNVIAQYPIAVTKDSTHATDAQAFEQYILSPQGQSVLNKYGFIGVTG